MQENNKKGGNWALAMVIIVNLLMLIYTVNVGVEASSARFGLSVDGLRNGEYYRCITYMFTHGGILHFLFNMMALWTYGRLVIGVFSATRFLAVYMGAGVFAGLEATLYRLSTGDVHVTSVGASGAVLAICALVSILLWRAKHRGKVVVLTGILLLSVMIPQLDNVTHFFGWVFGCGAYFVCLYFDRRYLNQAVPQ